MQMNSIYKRTPMLVWVLVIFTSVHFLTILRIYSIYFISTIRDFVKITN